jgi:ATP-dependent RNA helicase RhlE
MSFQRNSSHHRIGPPGRGIPRSSGRNFGRNPGFNRKKEFCDIAIFTRKAQDLREQIAYVPTHTFADFQLGSALMSNVASRGYTIPTPIQDQVIAPLMAGQDLVGIASTGSGKTAAFLLPLIEKVAKNRSQKVLIVAPTRELAVQINDEFRQLSRGMGIFSAVCIGGLSLGFQMRDLYRNPNFVIGTPGRLRDLEEHRGLNFSGFSTIVLDEVDRMLDMGFITDVKDMISKLPRERQSLGFYATLPEDIKSLMRQFLHDPVMVTIAPAASVLNINQDVIRTNGRAKQEVLHDLLIKPGFDKVLIFGRTKHGIDKLLKDLTTRGFKVGSIHGNKSQGQRQRALNEFKQNKLKILLATDIASRGLDIDDVTHVINYDLPESYDDYVHRIGRTARAGKSGIALTFIDS